VAMSMRAFFTASETALSPFVPEMAFSTEDCRLFSNEGDPMTFSRAVMRACCPDGVLRAADTAGSGTGPDEPPPRAEPPPDCPDIPDDAWEPADDVEPPPVADPIEPEDPPGLEEGGTIPVADPLGSRVPVWMAHDVMIAMAARTRDHKRNLRMASPLMRT